MQFPQEPILILITIIIQHVVPWFYPIQGTRRSEDYLTEYIPEYAKRASSNGCSFYSTIQSPCSIFTTSQGQFYTVNFPQFSSHSFQSTWTQNLQFPPFRGLLVVAALVHENNNVSRSKSQAMPDKYLERCRNIGNADYDAFCEDAILSADL